MGRRPLAEEEPFVTIRAHPRRFAWGIPAVFVVSIGSALPVVERSLSLAIAIQLFIQTVGLLWLYLRVASWRGKGDREEQRNLDRTDTDREGLAREEADREDVDRT